MSSGFLKLKDFMLLHGTGVNLRLGRKFFFFSFLWFFMVDIPVFHGEKVSGHVWRWGWVWGT